MHLVPTQNTSGWGHAPVAPGDQIVQGVIRSSGQIVANL